MVVFHCSVKLPEGIYCNDWFQTDGDEVLPPPDHQFSQLGVSVFTFPGKHFSGKPEANKISIYQEALLDTLCIWKNRQRENQRNFETLWIFNAGAGAAVTEIAKNGLDKPIHQIAKIATANVFVSKYLTRGKTTLIPWILGIPSCSCEWFSLLSCLHLHQLSSWAENAMDEHFLHPP